MKKSLYSSDLRALGYRCFSLADLETVNAKRSRRADARVTVSQISTAFWKNVTQGEPEACWLWSRPFKRQPFFWASGRRWPAHRLSYLLAHGAIPLDLLVCHTCDTPACVNPRHLFTGTVLDNLFDMVGKGRQCRGHAINTSKLTADQVLEIRRRFKRRVVTQRMLATEYGVSRRNIECILNRTYWKHL